jgi:Leucine-rich repeat (LRR) protein
LTTEAINQANLPALFNLQKLNLNGNEITEFPLSLCYVKQLTHLGLAENLIEEIPQEITELFYLVSHFFIVFLP